MKKILILALFLSSLFSNDKFSNLKKATNNLIKNDKWEIFREVSLYNLKSTDKELSLICMNNESVMLSLSDSRNNNYLADFISISVNNKEDRIVNSFTYQGLSELEIHNLNYFLNELPDAKSISVKVGNEIFNFNPINYSDTKTAFEDCYIKSPFKENKNIQTNNQISESKDFWEIGWHQGNSMFHISNKNNNRLEIACNYESSSISLINSEIGLGKVINVIFDNERKIITPTYISVDERTSSDDTAWGNFMYWLQNSNHFVIEAENGKKYTFEPVNSQKILDGISESCTEYLM